MDFGGINPALQELADSLPYGTRHPGLGACVAGPGGVLSLSILRGSTLAGMDAGASDESLMLRYRDGDAAAFEILYARHRAGLFRFMLRGCRDRAVCEELFQEVWISLINARGRYEVRSKFRTWLYQMARHRVIDHLRRQKYVEVRANPGEEADPPAPVGEQPDRRAAVNQATDRLLELIDALPEEQREAFLLHEDGGLSVQEIAEVSGSNPETAKSRLRYALQKLRAGLEPYHE
jgi:RNA polymerase sigma-70 factor (ECF subfamily)